MKRIDDNLLAAYLEGSLDEEESRAVEEIIESDPELLDFVAEWVALNETMLSLPREEGKAVATGEHVEELLPFVRPVPLVADRPAARAASGYDQMSTTAPSYEAARPAAGNSRPVWRKFLVAASILAFVCIPMIILMRHQQPEDLYEPINRDNWNQNPIGTYKNSWNNNDRPLGTFVSDTMYNSDTIPCVDSIDLKWE